LVSVFIKEEFGEWTPKFGKLNFEGFWREEVILRRRLLRLLS